MHTIKFVFPVIISAVIFLAKKGNTDDTTQPAKHLAASEKAAELPDSVRITGKRVFYTLCSTCHKDTVGSFAPGYSVLSSMSPRAILASLTKGKMRQQAEKLTENERKAVAQWLPNSELKTTDLPKGAYVPFVIGERSITTDYSGWGGNLEGTGFRSTKQAGISIANISSLQLKWVFAFPDGSIIRSKPAVVGDWLIAGSQYGDLFAINRKTGKPGWHFAANAAIRGAIAIQQQENSITAFFADFSTNVYAVNIKTGKLLWSARAGIDAQSATTGSVVVYGGKVFVPITSTEVGSAANGTYNCCFSSGGVVALDAINGHRIWQHRVIAEAVKQTGKKKNGKFFYGPSGAPVWCSPTVDTRRGLLYIGTGENYTYPTTNTSDAIQALDLKTGRLVWNFQATKEDAYNLACPAFVNCPPKDGPDLDFGMAPILVKRKDGGDILVAGQKSGVVYALSPGQGKVIWQTRVGKGGMLGGIHWGMATDSKNVYAANSDNIIAIDRRDSALKPSPGVYALDLLTGKIKWKTPAPDCTGKKNCFAFNSAAPAVVPGIVFAGSLDGHIRGYSTTDGKILWDFDTAREYDAVNGIKARGGAIDGPAPVMADGMLFVNSGYGMFGQQGGNVLLAFGVDSTPVK